MSGPGLRVVRGDPTAEELAAVVVLLTARAAAAAEPDLPRPVRSLWAVPRLRQPVVARRGAWRASGRPT